jgi:hypothetical protein
VNELEPMDRELEELVRAEKTNVPVPSDALRARVLGAVEARIAALPPGGGGDGGDGSGGGGGTDGGGRGGSSALGRLVSLHPAASLALALAVGAALGGAVARTGAPPERVVYVDRPVPGPTTIELEPSPPQPIASAAPSAAPTPRAAPTRADPPTIDARGLAAERMLLDAARAALAHGAPDEALAAVDRHAATYPHGALREEREALAVKALAAAGRSAEARARGEHFRAEFPRSVSLASVNATLASLPE